MRTGDAMHYPGGWKLVTVRRGGYTRSWLHAPNDGPCYAFAHARRFARDERPGLYFDHLNRPYVVWRASVARKWIYVWRCTQSTAEWFRHGYAESGRDA